ncbi:MAG: hypothetical protein K8T91_00810 [Planctomycetes bacterium]|nr:hypothetical protein [Planctomycetota bacterium]
MKATVDRTKLYSEQVDSWVESAIRVGTLELEGLIATLPGVFPVDVVNSVHRLVNRGVLSERVAASLLHAIRPNLKPRLAKQRSSFDLPVPHPLDYDWRFTCETVDDLLRICHELGDSIVCLGTPTFFVAADIDESFPRITLIDRNTAMVDYLSTFSKGTVLRLDLLADTLPQLQADVIVADPPWYFEHIQAFLWVASQICRIGSAVVISLPPPGTRPAAQEEVERVLAWALNLGFDVVRLDEARLWYETPPFERNALKATGIRLSSNGWRKGTLCLLKKARNTNVRRPRFVLPRVEWTEANLRGSRICFRNRRQVDFDDPTPIPLVAGDILPSVSRRHRLREFVDVWSSGNRVFECRAPNVLQVIVEALAGNQNPVDTVADRFHIVLDAKSQKLVSSAAHYMETLAAIEGNERRFIGNG